MSLELPATTATPAPTPCCAEAALAAAGDRDPLSEVVALLAAAFDAPAGALAEAHEGQPTLLASVGHADAGLPRHHPLVSCHARHLPAFIVAAPCAATPPAQSPGFYAGIALHARDGRRLGTLGVWDAVPREAATPAQLDALARFGATAAALLEQRHARRDAVIAAQISEQAFDGVIVADATGRIRSCNRAAARLFSGTSLVGQRLPQLFPLRLQANAEGVRRWLQGDGEGLQSLRVLGADGSPRLLEATRCAWEHEGEHGITLVLHDVTEASIQRAQLDRLAHYDPLTGLPNRNALLAALASNSGAEGWGVALIAIDRFKWVNDSLGHAVGDRVLQLLAGRLQVEADENMCLARIGGDEFAIACSDSRLAPGPDGAPCPLLQRLLHRISQPLLVQGHEIQAEASVGVALRADVDEGGDLLACADLALYRAKAAGGRQQRHYQPAMRTEALARRELDLELRRAFAQGEFELHYQPQICLRNGRTCGAEALLRWRHPQRGLVPAFQFIEALSRSSLGADVGAWVLERACYDASRWPDDSTPVSVNLFPAQLGLQLVGQVEAALAASGLAPHRLELEITETIALAHDGDGADALAQLRARGVRLAFDDFGTGYASLAMLQRFAIDCVKIDRSFVNEMLAKPGDAAIVRWIVMLAANLGLRVVAEGVEHDRQADLLRELGCGEAQGYLYAPALGPRELVARLLAQHAAESVDG